MLSLCGTTGTLIYYLLESMPEWQYAISEIVIKYIAASALIFLPEIICSEGRQLPRYEKPDW